MKVIANIVFTDPASSPQYPAGTTTSGTQVSINVPSGAAAIAPQTIAPGVTTATFDGVPAGTGYTVTAQLLDGNGQALGTVMTSAAFDVPAPTVGIPTPASISVSVTA